MGNLTLGNLGGDGQSLEEGSLLGSQPGVVSGNDHSQWRNSSRPGRRTDLVLQKFVTDLSKRTIIFTSGKNTMVLLNLDVLRALKFDSYYPFMKVLPLF